MKKLLVAMMILLATTSAFAAVGSKVQPNATFQFGVGGAAFGPTTTNNDDTCDISVAPAATLLLPYFEVDFTAPATTARTTLFTVTNTTAVPQIAHVTIWTDWSFPVLDFNIFLTGYDVQAINLYDVLARGLVGQTGGTSISATGGENNPTNASRPYANTANPNFLASAVANCAAGRLPGQIPDFLLRDLRAYLTTGRTAGAGGISCANANGTQQQVGSSGHTTAIGYITIDVAATCSVALPTNPTYFRDEILYDNVLIGDYQDVNPNATTGNFAGGNPMVHIRAVPEGGPAGFANRPQPTPTNLPYTFYDRYTNGAGIPRTMDRRQPLPSMFAARYIQGGTGQFDTRYKIWREGFTGNDAACASYAANSNIGIAELVRFDEHENANIISSGLIISPPPQGQGIAETQQIPVSSSVFPAINSPAGDLGGWMYLNLHNGGAAAYSRTTPGAGGATTTTGTGLGSLRPSQNWVIVSMFAEGRYSVDFDAAWLSNGCTPARAANTDIGPNQGGLVCPPGVAGCTSGAPQYPTTGGPVVQGTNANP